MSLLPADDGLALSGADTSASIIVAAARTLIYLRLCAASSLVLAAEQEDRPWLLLAKPPLLAS